MELSASKIAVAKCVGSARLLCSESADLCQTAAQRVEQLGVLRHQKFANFVVHQNGVVTLRI